MHRAIVGIAGGTGSGKTTLAQKILEAVGEDSTVLIEQDAYYRDQSHLPLKERAGINYDHPDALDTPLLIEHLGRLRDGKPVPHIQYDFRTHSRTEPSGRIVPKKLVIVEGILILHHQALRALMDLKIFVDAAPDVRIIRRLERDMRERGRRFESVVKQYLASVRPMHQAFVEPSKAYADLIVSGEEPAAIEKIVGQIDRLLSVA